MNDSQKQLIQHVTGNFNREAAFTDTEFATTLHYTAIVPVEGELRQALANLQQHYLSLEPSLQLVSPELLHLTLGHDTLQQDWEVLRDITKTYLAESPRVMCAGLIADTARGALGVAYWSNDDFFLRYRQTLAQAIGEPFDSTNPRNTVGWTTLARFTQMPSPQLVEYVQAHMFQEFGDYTLTKAIIYKAHRSDLAESEIMGHIVI